MTVAPVTGPVRFVERSAAVLGDFLTHARRNDAPIAAEFFTLRESPVVDFLEQEARRGRAVDLLVNHPILSGWDRSEALVAKLRDAGVTVTPYAPDALDGMASSHTKLFHLRGDHPQTWMHNSVVGPWGKRRTDLAAVISGPAADAAYAVTRAGMTGDAIASGRAVDRAARLGAVFNDPLSDRWYATAAMHDTMALDTPNLDVHVKALDHPATTARIVDAHRDGRRVSVSVRDIAPEDADLLLTAHVPTTMLDTATPNIHHNVVTAGDTTYAGTAYPWSSMAGGHPLLGASRDSGSS